jgi:DNA-binding NarL/FixJ family response regulator
VTAASQNPITLLIADDHPIVRSGLRSVLEKSPGLKVIHEAENGDSALQLIRQSKPDVAIIDVEMPVMDGFAVARAVQDGAIGVNVIIMTMHKDEQTFNKAMDIGINGFVLKENAVADIVSAIHAVMEGRHYVSPSLSEYLMQRVRPPAPVTSAIEALTPAE